VADTEGSRLRFLRRAGDHPRARLRRGVYLLPSLFTLGNMFCGFICIVHTLRGDYESAAPFIGFAFVLDAPRWAHRAVDRGRERIRHRVRFAGGRHLVRAGTGDSHIRLGALGRLGLAAGLLFVSAAAMRLARFNIQTGTGMDKRYFVGMPSPPAAGVLAATVYAYPPGLSDYRAALPALALVLVPAALMVSTIRFRSFKTFDLQSRRPYSVLIVIAAAIVAIWAHPRAVLVLIAYSYLASAFIGIAITRFKPKGERADRGPIDATGDQRAPDAIKNPELRIRN